MRVLINAEVSGKKTKKEKKTSEKLSCNIKISTPTWSHMKDKLGKKTL